MKKSITFVLTLAAAASLLAGCGAKKGTEEATQNITGQKEETAQDQTETQEAANYSVALMIPGNLGDKSFFDAAYNSIDLLKKELGVSVDYVEAGTDSSKYYATYVDLCEQSYDLILTVSGEGNDALVEAAEEFPEQKFINLDDTMDDLPENIYVMAPRNNEMSFLAGTVAALKAEELGESVIGFIGGMDIPGINEFLVGYIEGAQYITPEIKVSSSYVGSFTDTAKGKESAILMYNSGVSVIFTAAGQSGLGVIDAAKEKGKLVIGVDSDQAEALKDSQPELAETIITSAIKNIDADALYIVDKAMKGEVTYGVRELYGIDKGAVGIAQNEYYEKLMTKENRDKVDEIIEKVKKGEVEMSDTSGMTTEELEKIRDTVRP